MKITCFALMFLVFCLFTNLSEAGVASSAEVHAGKTCNETSNQAFYNQQHTYRNHSRSENEGSMRISAAEQKQGPLDDSDD